MAGVSKSHWPTLLRNSPAARYLLLLALAAESFNFVYLLIQEAGSAMSLVQVFCAVRRSLATSNFYVASLAQDWQRQVVDLRAVLERYDQELVLMVNKAASPVLLGSPFAISKQVPTSRPRELPDSQHSAKPVPTLPTVALRSQSFGSQAMGQRPGVSASELVCRSLFYLRPRL